jgi:hypothetical protein
MKGQSKRTINYFELSVQGYSGNIYALVEKVLRQLIQSKAEGANPRKVELASGSRAGAYMVVHEVLEVGSYFYCKGKVIRNDDYPGITNIETNEETVLAEESDSTKFLYYETHFLVTKNPKQKDSEVPLFAIESNRNGMSEKEIASYIHVLISSYVDENAIVTLNPLFVLDLSTFKDRVKEVSKITMLVNRVQLDQLQATNSKLGKLFRAGFDYSDSEFIELEFGIRFNAVAKRHRTRTLRENAIEIVETLQNQTFGKKSLFERGFTKLFISGEDSHVGDKLRIFDILGQRVGSEVSASKVRDTSQYYNSIELYNGIKEIIEKDFQ